jgi:hypothetical protein
VIAVDENTYIEEGIVIGDRVLVTGTILDGGTMLAEIILGLEGTPGMPFQFTGIIEAIGSDVWTISGVSITVNEDTVIDEGLAVGDLVDVSGQILDGGIWLAERIERTTTSLPGFSILGLVESIDPWQVAGIGFETEEWTIIEPGIAVGDEVLVQGVIQEDGTWVAATIKKLGDDDDDDDGTIVFIGIVDSIDPWIVNGIELVVTADTIIGDDIDIGDLVIVRIELLPDGTWQTVSILLLDSDIGQGCIVINTIIIIIGSGDIVVLEGWPELPIDGDDFDDLDDIEPNSVVSVTICFDFDGTIIIISPIIIIYQPIIIILPPSPGPPQPPGGGGNNNDNRNDNG